MMRLAANKRLQLTPNSSPQSIRGAVLAAGLLCLSVDGQRCPLQLNHQGGETIGVAAQPEAEKLEPSHQELGASASEIARVKIFIWIKLFFLAVSAFAGGFHFKVWSMLDTALLIQSIGVTGLIVVLDEPYLRRLAFRAAVILYLLAIVDMGINVLVSGVVGWRVE